VAVVIGITSVAAYSNTLNLCICQCSVCLQGLMQYEQRDSTSERQRDENRASTFSLSPWLSHGPADRFRLNSPTVLYQENSP